LESDDDLEFDLVGQEDSQLRKDAGTIAFVRIGRSIGRLPQRTAAAIDTVDHIGPWIIKSRSKL
jgi:hypothetical protein